MKFLCYGARGWIGTQMVDLLRKRNHQVVAGKERCDDYEKVFEEIQSVQPDYVFCSIGRTHGTDEKTNIKYSTIDYLELPGKLSINVADNLVGPLNLARACKELQLQMAYIGTGCIFEYDKQHLLPQINEEIDDKIDCSNIVGFTEADLPNFTKSYYSTVKGWTDVEMRKFPQTVLNLRIRMPISGNDNPRDFITKITNYKRVCSIPNSMTVLPQLLPIMVIMMEQGVTGTFNMCNPGLVTHNQILRIYQKYVDSGFEINNFSLEEQSQILKAGRSNNYLDTTRLQQYCADNNLQLDNIYVAVSKILWQRGMNARMVRYMEIMNPHNNPKKVQYSTVCKDCQEKNRANLCVSCSAVLEQIESLQAAERLHYY